MTTIYRAATSPILRWRDSCARDPQDAETYLAWGAANTAWRLPSDEPRALWETEATGEVVDLSGDDWRDVVAETFECDRPSDEVLTVDQWFFHHGGDEVAHCDWIRFIDSVPEGCETWIRCALDEIEMTSAE